MQAALRYLAPDITLLVGDFGNENVELVRQVGGVAAGGGEGWIRTQGENRLARQAAQS